MSELTERIVATTMAFDGSDYDQRSALGMARTWVEKGVKPEWVTSQIENKRRDDLAKELVSVMEELGGTPEERILALRAARKKVNEPFYRENPLGTAGKKPKEQKKDSK